MTQWAKILRKWHRWMSIPMLILIPVSAALKFSGNGKVMANIPAWEQAQSLIMLLLAISGGYLYLFRIVNKRRRTKRRARAEVAESV
ncbi:MAG: hypothetical protein ABFR95_05355 [Actinomycetota bacterium]